MSPTQELAEQMGSDPRCNYGERGERTKYGLEVHRAICTGKEVPAPSVDSIYRGAWLDMVLAAVQLHRPIRLERDQRSGIVYAMADEG